jgi:colicin import membrane protein
MNTKIIILDQPRQIQPQDLFLAENMDGLLNEIAIQAKSIVLDPTTEEGRGKIKSLAYKVAKTKTAIDDAGKSLTKEWKRQSKAVDAVRKNAREFLNNLKEEISKPADEFDEMEQMRIGQRQNRITQIEKFKDEIYTSTGAEKIYLATIEQVKELEVFDWQEFTFKAQTAAKEVITILNLRFEAAKQARIDAEELEKLRKDKEERDKADNEKRIAEEAAKKAKFVAEMEAAKKAKKLADEAAAEKERIKNEKLKAERDKINAENRALEAERWLRNITEMAEKNKILAEKKAKDDAEKAAADAVKKEQEKVAEEKRLEDEATAKREADKKYKQKIYNEMMLPLCVILDEPQAKAVIKLIAENKVPHIFIKY